MYFLTSVCDPNNTTLDPVFTVIGYVIDAIMIGVPILLIVFGMIDLGKAVISSKEDEVKKATKAFGKRFLYAVGVFAVVWIVTLVLNIISGIGLDQVNSETTSGWEQCWCKIRKNCSDDDDDENPEE